MISIEKIISSSKISKNNYESYLRHPIFGTKHQPRKNFVDIQECFTGFFTKGTEPRMLGLAGLRGTGKTTLLWQTAELALESGFEDVYYFDIEAIYGNNTRIIDIQWYIKINTPKFFEKKVILLFDEVQMDPQWATGLKIWYENHRTAFIIATGSSALLLQSTADLATRMLFRHTFPLQLSEYIKIKYNVDANQELSKSLESTLFFSENFSSLKEKITLLKPQINTYYNQISNHKELINNYLKFHNITRFAFFDNFTFITDEINSLVNRVIYEDIPILTKEIPAENSYKLLLRLAASDEINIQTLSQAIGISQQQIADTLTILDKAQLINILYPFGGVDTKLNKARKAFFMSPSIRLALLTKLRHTITAETEAKLYEDIVVMYLKHFFLPGMVSFTNSDIGRNPDFIIETLDKPIILEVGTGKKTSKQISKSNIQYRYGIVVNATIDEISFENETLFLPLPWFLLL